MSRVKLLVAFCPITTHSSRIVLFTIESTENSYESDVAGVKNLSIEQVDQWSEPMVQLIKFLEWKMITWNF